MSLLMGKVLGAIPQPDSALNFLSHRSVVSIPPSGVHYI
jgi:hypothetical protein